MAIDSEKIQEAIVQMQASGNESTFINELLYGALNWPIAEDYDEMNIEDISYSWNDILDEMGFESNDAPVDLRQIRPFPGWPLGIFIIRFGSDKFFTTGRGMTLPLRKILRNLVQKLRPTSTHPSWKQEQLLFLCHNQTQYFQFAHFKQIEESSKTSQLRMFGWGPNDQIRTICEHNLPGLVYDESISQSEVINNLDNSFDVRKVSKQFYLDYNTEFGSVEKYIQKSSSIADSKQIRQATQTFFNRLLFLRFIEKKGWLKFGDSEDYLKELYCEKGVKSKTFFSSRLRRLFFEGLAIEGKQKHDAYGEVPFLNGGLFEETELDKQIIDLPDNLFEPLLSSNGLFYRYNFTVQESTPLDVDVAIDPEMIGTMFEELVTGKKGKGAFYTPRIVVSYMCREAIKSVIEEKTDVDKEIIINIVDFNDDKEISVQDARKINLALLDIKAIDPACGSGAYLLGLLHELIRIHSLLSTNLEDFKETNHEMKLRIISNSIYGSDIDPFATNIAMLRLWLSLSVEATEPTPLPNLDFNIETGDSLLAPDPSSYVFDVTGSIEKADELALKKEKYLISTGSKARELKKEIRSKESEIRKALRKQNNQTESVDFRVNFASVFTKNGGFDIVLANPPYVKHQDLSKNLKKKLKSVFIKSKNSPIRGTSDLYCYFYVRSNQLLRSGGIQIFICSNTWLDVAFGIPLQHFFLRTSQIDQILDSEVERQFQSADINTVITFIRKKKVDKNHDVRFTFLKGPFSKSTINPDLQKIKKVNQVYMQEQGTDSREKYIGKKWSNYLRAPDVYWNIITNYSEKLVKLSEIANLSTGVKTGCDKFFILSKESITEWGIEDDFLLPLFKSSTESLHTHLNQSDLNFKLFYCNKPKSDIKGTNSLKYIEWGEKQGFDEWAKPKTMKYWYAVGNMRPAPIICPRSMNEIYRVFLNEDNHIANFRLSELHPSDLRYTTAIFAILTSTFTSFMVELGARTGLGQGVLDMMGYELAAIKIPHPKYLKHLKPLNREIGSLEFEMSQEDRLNLDKQIFDVLDIPRTARRDFYESYIHLVKNRIGKSNNITNPIS